MNNAVIRACIGLALLVPFASAQTTCASIGANPATSNWYVDATATNPSATGSKADPFPNLSVAYLLADDNDRIFVAPGTYAPSTGETFPLQWGSSATVSQLNIEIIGTGGAAATILDGENLTSGFGILRFRRLASGAKLRGFTITNYSGTLGAIRLGSTSSGFEAHDVEISHCVIRDSAASGIATFGASESLKIHSNLFLNNGDNAVWLSDISSNTNPCSGARAGGEVYNNTFDGNQNGIRVQGGTWSIYNNVFTNSTANGIFDFGLAGFPAALGAYTLDHNCFFGNGTDLGGGLAAGPNAVFANPAYVGVGDYHLSAGSPCVDAGRTVPNWVESDMDSDPRNVGGSIDIGADELNDVSHFVSPASLALPAVTFDVSGPAGDLVLRAYSFAPGNTNFPAQGNLLLDFAQATILDAVAAQIPASGTLTLPISLVGLSPAAIGLPIWSQAFVTGPSSQRFTNSRLTVICP